MKIRTLITTAAIALSTALPLQAQNLDPAFWASGQATESMCRYGATGLIESWEQWDEHLITTTPWIILHMSEWEYEYWFRWFKKYSVNVAYNMMDECPDVYQYIFRMSQKANKGG